MVFKATDTRYDTMLYRRCGHSGLRLPAVSLGLWHNFGEITPLSSAREMIYGAFDLGITHFDLANNYGPPAGSAEESLGKIMHDSLRAYRDEMIISTKAGYYMWPGPYGEWGSKKNLLASLDQSLRRLQMDYVDIFYHHRPDPDTPIEESMEALVTALNQGKALYVGISNYSAEDTKKASDILSRMGCRCLIHQHKYSMFERKNEEKLLDVLREEGIGGIAFSPLAQGLLTDRYLNGIPQDSRAAGSSIFLSKEAITEERMQKVTELNEMAAARGQKLAQMALAWDLRRPEITSVIIGASKMSQIKENVDALSALTFSDEELSRIERILHA